MIVSILVMCIVPIYQVLPRVIISILLLPVVVGISYEFIRIAGKSNNWLTRALSWPGLQIQRITTREPDASQIECAIAALEALHSGGYGGRQVVNTPRAAMQTVQQKLAEAGLDSVQFESRILLETVLNCPVGHLSRSSP